MRAGYSQTILSATEIFTERDGSVGGVWVGCNPASVSGILVTVKTLHKESKMPIYIGGGVEFISSDRKITQITVEPLGASSLIDWGVTRE